VNGDRGDGSRLARALLVAAIAALTIALTVAAASGDSIRTLASAIATAPSTGLDAALRAAGSATGIETNATPRGRAPVTLNAARRLNPRHHHGANHPSPTPVVGESNPTAPNPTAPPSPTSPPGAGTPPSGDTPEAAPTPPSEPDPEVPSPPTDTTAPQTSITDNPTTGTTDTSASFSFASSETESNFACRLDGGAWVSCESPQSYSGLAVGSHTFRVRASDGSGNVDSTPSSYGWTIEAIAPPPPTDTVPPQTSITSKPPEVTTSTAAQFSFAANESGASFECKLDDGSWVECSPPLTYSSIETGEHEFLVRATDTAENVDRTPAAAEWTVEEPSPPPPPPPASGCTTTATSVAAVQSAVSTAAPGSVVCLAGGSYGQLPLDAAKAAPGVTVRAASPGGTTIASASLQGTNLTLARFVVTGGVQVEPGATGMTIEHNRITGGGQGIDAGPTSTTTINDTRIVGNELIGPFGEDAIHLNRYHDADGNGIGILIEGNEITNVRENGNHSDCLQTVWVGDHLVFRKNYLHDNRCQGFFVKDQASLGGVSGPINGITVDDNLFLRNQEPCDAAAPGCGQPNYFQVFGPYSGFTMTRNTIWGDGDSSIATFREGTGSDTQIANNVIYRLWTDTNMSAATLSNNTVCKLETGAGGSWPTSRPGQTTSCSLGFQSAAADDYRLSGGRGVDWAPAEQHYGP
jgi:hypothetical protein